MRTQLPICLATLLIAAWSSSSLADSSRSSRASSGRDHRSEGPRQVDVRRAPPRYEPFHRGERIAPQYRHHNYAVENWRAYRLPPPPRGYRWIGVGPDFLLVAIATGIIAEVLIHGQPVVSAPATTLPQAAAGGSAPQAAGFWYYCESANAFYPYVSQCPGGWRTVPATPPPPSR